jgi:type VI secretion system protein ImpK
LYQGLLTSIVRVCSGSAPIIDCDDFQKRIIDVLNTVEREAIRIGYSDQDVEDTNFAIVAFLDEAILMSNDPSKTSWAPLQAKLYGKADSGEGFFERLQALGKRRDSGQLIDVLEVYYLCLLLGYQGRYAGYAKAQSGELRQSMDDLRTRIEAVRGREMILSKPMAAPAPALSPAPSIDTVGRILRLAAIAACGGLLLLWLVCRFWLSTIVSDTQTSLLS